MQCLLWTNDFQDAQKARHRGTCCLDIFVHIIVGVGLENIEPGGRNSINFQTEPAGAFFFFGLKYKGEQGARAVCAPSKSALGKGFICAQTRTSSARQKVMRHGRPLLIGMLRGTHQSQLIETGICFLCLTMIYT